MTATDSQPDVATPATPGARLDVALFDALAERVGALDDEAKAELMGVSRSTMWRYRNGKLQPSVEVALRMAERLSTTVNQLFPRRAA